MNIETICETNRRFAPEVILSPTNQRPAVSFGRRPAAKPATQTFEQTCRVDRLRVTIGELRSQLLNLSRRRVFAPTVERLLSRRISATESAIVATLNR